MERFNKIGIIGIGGVGGYYGGQLAAYCESLANTSITFIARGKHLKAIQQQGLTIKTDAKTFNCQPDLVTDDLKALADHQLLVVCVKNYGLENIVELLQTIVQPETIILPLLNGVSSSDFLREKLGQGIILDGCVYVNSYISAAGEITQYGSFDKMLFGHKNQLYREEITAVEQLMLAAGIRAKVEQNILEKTWAKYLLISAIGTVTSAENKTVGMLMENERTQQLLMGVMQEVFALAHTKGILLETDLVHTTFERFKKFDYDAKSSMLLDFEKGKETELESLTGFVVHESAKLELKTPVTSGLYALLKAK